MPKSAQNRHPHKKKFSSKVRNFFAVVLSCPRQAPTPPNRVWTHLRYSPMSILAVLDRLIFGHFGRKPKFSQNGEKIAVLGRKSKIRAHDALGMTLNSMFRGLNTESKFFFLGQKKGGLRGGSNSWNPQFTHF